MGENILAPINKLFTHFKKRRAMPTAHTAAGRHQYLMLLGPEAVLAPGEWLTDSGARARHSRGTSPRTGSG